MNNNLDNNINENVAHLPAHIQNDAARFLKKVLRELANGKLESLIKYFGFDNDWHDISSFNLDEYAGTVFIKLVNKDNFQIRVDIMK